MTREAILQASRKLRREMTPEERHLWYAFLSPHPLQFYRQRVIGNFIADFYCPKVKLIIELDGMHHCEEEYAQRDAERTACLEGRGRRVIRYSNREINENFRGVCEDIDNTIDQILAKSTKKA